MKSTRSVEDKDDDDDDDDDAIPHQCNGDSFRQLLSNVVCTKLEGQGFAIDPNPPRRIMD
jgi:hypothetical protein